MSRKVALGSLATTLVGALVVVAWFASSSEGDEPRDLSFAARSPSTEASTNPADSTEMTETAATSAGRPPDGVSSTSTAAPDTSAADPSTTTIRDAEPTSSVPTSPAAPTTNTAVTSTTDAPGPGDTPVPDGTTVAVSPGDDLAAVVNAHPPGTTFVLEAGTHAGHRVRPRTGDRFVGEPGAIMAGEGTDLAFVGDANGVLIEGLIIERYANPPQLGAIHTTGENWEVRNNEIRYNATAGLVAGPGWKVVNNHVHHNGQIGIKAGGADVLIEGNEIAFNNYRDDFAMDWEAGGTKFLDTVDLVVRNNYVHDNHGAGLWTDSNNIGTLYEGNVVVDNYGPGIFHEISYDAVIRNNEVTNNAHGFYTGGILISSSSGVEVRDNTLRGNKGGVAAVQADRGEGTYGPYHVRDLWVHDNDVAYQEGWTGLRVSGGDTGLYANGNNRFDANTYRVPTEMLPYFWSDGQISPKAWRDHGQDGNSKWLPAG